MNLKKDILEKHESLRSEIKLMEKNEGSMADVWKNKCRELVEVCNNLKGENDILRENLKNRQEESFLPKLMQSQQVSSSKLGKGGHQRYSSVSRPLDMSQSYIQDGSTSISK